MTTPITTEADWLATIRANALSVAVYFDDLRSDDPAEARISLLHYAYGALQGTTLSALTELARPEPDTNYIRQLLMRGYANAETVRGNLDEALAMLVEIDAARQRLVDGHYLVPGEFWQGSIRYVVAYLYNEVRGDCWGSPEKVREWLASREDGRWTQ